MTCLYSIKLDVRGNLTVVEMLVNVRSLFPPLCKLNGLSICEEKTHHCHKDVYVLWI